MGACFRCDWRAPGEWPVRQPGLDLEIDVKHNETSHFTALLQPLDLAGVVVTFDALHTVRANPGWLAGT